MGPPSIGSCLCSGNTTRTLKCMWRGRISGSGRSTSRSAGGRQRPVGAVRTSCSPHQLHQLKNSRSGQRGQCREIDIGACTNCGFRSVARLRPSKGVPMTCPGCGFNGCASRSCLLSPGLQSEARAPRTSAATIVVYRTDRARLRVARRIEANRGQERLSQSDSSRRGVM